MKRFRPKESFVLQELSGLSFRTCNSTPNFRANSNLVLCINFRWRSVMLQNLVFILLVVVSLVRFGCRLGKICTSSDLRGDSAIEM